jgi:proteasome lid subunit RPN8/RPN11
MRRPGLTDATELGTGGGICGMSVRTRCTATVQPATTARFIRRDLDGAAGQPVGRASDSFVKSRIGESRIFLARASLERGTRAAASADPRETGGVLLGFRGGDDVYVTDLLPVRATVASRTRFVSSQVDRDAAIESYQSHLPGDSVVGYVGTWHSHVADSAASGIDRRTFHAEAARAPDLVAMVILRKADESWCVDGLVGHHERRLDFRRMPRVRRRQPWVTPAQVVLCV